MALDQPVRVLGLGLDVRFRSMLDIFFSRSGRGAYTFSEEVADLIVVDMDAIGAKEEYVVFQEENAGKPSILFSLSENDYRTRGNTILLRKPFTVRQLQSAFEILTIRYLGGLPVVPVDQAFGESEAVEKQRAKFVRETVEEQRDRRIRERAEKQRARTLREQARQDKWNEQKLAKLNSPKVAVVKETDASPVPMPEPAPVETPKKAQTAKAASSLARREEYVKLESLMSEPVAEGEEKLYNPVDYLQGALMAAQKKATKQKKNAVIKLGSGTIILDPSQGLAQVRMGDYQLREVSSFSLKKDNINVTMMPAKEAPIDEGGKGKVVSLPSLVWKTALYAARGRVPAGTDMDAPRQLKDWPNLTRLLLVPGAVRMSAVWTVQANSIAGLAERLGLAQRDVSGFYSAAHALNLFEASKEIKPVKALKKHKSSEEGIFKRILNRLRAFS